MDDPAFLVAIGSSAFAAIVILTVLRRRLLATGVVSHSLGLALLHITLPPAVENKNIRTTAQDLQERIAIMEQVFAELATIRESGFHAWFYGKPFFSFELAVPHIGQEVLLYCAVPRRNAEQIEKMVIGHYPEARVEHVQDYTVFYPTGTTAGAVGFPKNRYLPLTTFRSMTADPLGSVLNAFSKVAHEGEGLALQVVAQVAGGKWNRRLGKLARSLREGKTLGKARSETERHFLLQALRSTKQKEAEAMNRGPVNEPLAQAVERKAQRSLFSVNLRILASGQTQERADTLVRELAAPFAQFTNEEVNRLTFKPRTKGGLMRLAYQFAFRLPDRNPAVILSTDELASIIHLPNTVLGMAHVSSIKAKDAPAPIAAPRDGLLLGINVFRGVETPMYMAPEDRARHLYVIGQTGTGKTVFLKNLIIQDIERGEGVCFIDPHGDAVEAILEHIPPSRTEDVIYFNPGDIARPLGLNMLEYDPAFPEQKTFIINELLAIFNKLYDMKTVGGPMFEQYFRNATALVMDDPASGNTLLEINRVFVDKKFRDAKLSRTANPLVRTFWRDIAEKAGGESSLQNIVPYISSKFDSFLSNEIMRPIVAQERSAFRLREVMDQGKILLINLSKGRLGELNSALIGLIMIGKILMAAFSRGDTPEERRRTFSLFIDEFQNVTTDSIESILSEARKYRLNLILAHQFIGQLSDEIKKAVFGNVGSMAVFRVGSEDGEFLEKQFAPQLTAFDLINMDNYRCYVKLLIHGQTAPPFSMRTFPVARGNPEVAARAKEHSRITYGRDRETVEEEIRGKFNALAVPPVPPKPPDFGS